MKQVSKLQASAHADADKAIAKQAQIETNKSSLFVIFITNFWQKSENQIV